MTDEITVKPPTMVDLYSGCGGVTQGFKSKGFKVLAAVESNSTAAATYRLNHPEVALYDKDIREVTPDEMLTRCGLQPGELTVLSVCAPCQPFSRQNRSKKDENRTRLVLEMLRFTEALKPKFAFMENVPGLAKGKNKNIFDELIGGLTKLGYVVSQPRVVDAANYGVPQFRKRLILLASREKMCLAIPDITHVSPGEAEKAEKAKWQTVGEAFEGLCKLDAGQQSQSDTLHKARSHTALNLERIKHIPHNGGSRRSLPLYLRLKCHQNGEDIGYNDVYGRLDSRKPSNTLTTGCTNFTKGRFAHPTEDRAITPREAARLQTFPDTYRFDGSHEQIARQIGNAVPVGLAEAFASYFYDLEMGK
jgi:DNA (cytosine-5)-methyltransferase 1